MSSKISPQRKDLATGKTFDKEQLIRVVVDKNNQVTIDETGKLAGRGAYILIDNQSAKIVKNKKLLDRALKVKVDDQTYEQLEQLIDHKVARKELSAD